MDNFDWVEDDTITKIPYDKEPITRARLGDGRTTNNYVNSKSHKLLYVLVGMLFVLNIIMGGFLLKFVVFNDVAQVVNNPTYNITTDGTNTAWAAASKAKLSAVCISAGFNTNSGTNITYQTFFNMSSRGSGVFIEVDKETGEALIVTCYHVIENYTSQVYILAYDSYTPIKATVVNYSANYDIAVLKVDANTELQTSSCIAATVADSSSVVEGQLAIAVGNPLAMGFSVTCGVISSPLNLISIDNVTSRVIKVDTPINSGNSGGGLFNDKGELIGIVNAKLMSSEVDNVAYAIPSNLAINLSNSIIRNGSSSPTIANLGLTLSILSTGNSVDGETGKLVQSIMVDSVNFLSPCATAGIKSGDKLVSLAYGDTYVPIQNLYDVEDNMFNLSVGDTVSITVERNGVELTYSVKITSTSKIS